MIGGPNLRFVNLEHAGGLTVKGVKNLISKSHFRLLGPFVVIPAKPVPEGLDRGAGIQCFQAFPDARLRHAGMTVRALPILR